MAELDVSLDTVVFACTARGIELWAAAFGDFDDTTLITAPVAVLVTPLVVGSLLLRGIALRHRARLSDGLAVRYCRDPGALLRALQHIAGRSRAGAPGEPGERPPLARVPAHPGVEAVPAQPPRPAGPHPAARAIWENGRMTQTTHAPSHVGTSFRRMDESTAEEWAVIGSETFSRQERVGDRVLGMLESLAEISDGFAVDQLTHCLQTATRAERAGADDEVVIASLCHDIGKAVSVPNHPRIAAEILRPYVRDDVYWMVLVHQDFQGRHYYHHFGGDPDARDQYEGHAAYELAERFADEWDQTAFDPDYDTLPLEHFEPRLRELFRHPKSL